MTNVEIKDGIPVCPNCKSESLSYAHDVTCYGDLYVQDGQVVAGQTVIDWSTCGDSRVWCSHCDWTEENTDIEIVE